MRRTFSLLWLPHLVLITALLGFSANAPGLGFRIPNQDAAAIARGNAFAATADNPSALYYNPAGITQLEGQYLQVGFLSYLGVSSRYKSFTGGNSETKWEIQPVPQLYYVLSPAESPLSFGLGVYAPFGLGLEWPQSSGFRTLAIEADLRYITVTPVVALQIHPKLSLAVGPTINYSDLSLRQGIGFTPRDEFRFEGDDFDYGVTAGLLWKFHSQWSFGAKYFSATEMKYHGTSETRGLPGPAALERTSSVQIKYPQMVSAGISYRPTPDWNFEVDVDWTDWNTLNRAVFKGTFAGTINLPLNWESSFFYHFGATRTFQNGWFASAGYFFSENSTSEKNFNPIVPDTDLHVGSLGVGHNGKHWNYALAGQIITGPWRTVDSSRSTSAIGQTANGRYKFFIPAVTFSVAYHF